MGKTENDYIAEYVKQRCPEVIQTIDYRFWRLGKAVEEFAQTITDSFKFIDWSKVSNLEGEEVADDKEAD